MSISVLLIDHFAYSMSGLIFGKGIFSTIRDDHRKYRKIMMPPFANTTNLRGMIPIFYEVAERVSVCVY
jgi:cytochrome P450